MSAKRQVHRIDLTRVSQIQTRARAATALGADPGMRVVEQGADVVVVDCPVENIAQVAREGEQILAVVVPQADRRTTTAALDAGAQAVIAESEVAISLPAAVHAIRSGLVVVPLAARQAVRRPILSSREKQILGMVVVGLTNADIARRLYLAESTVKSHLSSIFAKLGVRSRKEAADLVLDPSTGLGTGILTITPPERPATPYARPRVA